MPLALLEFLAPSDDDFSPARARRSRIQSALNCHEVPGKVIKRQPIVQRIVVLLACPVGRYVVALRNLMKDRWFLQHLLGDYLRPVHEVF